MTLSDVQSAARAGTAEAAAFRSILFAAPPPGAGQPVEQPECFPDLNLDQVAQALTKGREEYDLLPFLHMPLATVAEIGYRQDAVRDLEDGGLAGRVRAFAAAMRVVREKLATADKLRHSLQKASWVLDAVAAYRDAVRTLAADLGDAQLHAAGWRALREHLDDYLRAEAFRRMTADVDEVRKRLSAVTYCVRIHGGRVGVSRYEQQPDYSAQVTATFAKFRQGDVPPRQFRIKRFVEMDHVEKQILDRVAQLFPEEFRALLAFADRHRDFMEPTLARFDREVQFYLGYLEFIAPLRQAGLPFSRPDVDPDGHAIEVRDTFDLALAHKLVEEQAPVVGNDLELAGAERILVVTGPNQGGKTTMARTFGQLHHLAALGLPVPGRSARLPLADRVFTQFERGENMADLSGKLADDLTRIRAVLDQATARSVVVVNEIFTSTTLDDARELGAKILQQLIDRGCLGVWVTFDDELAALGPQVVSMVAQVDPDDPARRTHKVLRKPADGRAYADVLAAKYGLTFDRLTGRLGQERAGS